MNANAVAILGQRTTLADLLRSIETAERPPARRREAVHVVRHDLALMQELFGADAVEARLRELLVERSLQEVTIKVQDAGARPLQIVPEYVRRRPTAPSTSALDARSRTERRCAALVMMIDGVDLPQWTVGQCRTAARRKGKEYRILERLARELHDKADADVVGAFYSTEVLQRYVLEDL